MLKHSAKLGFMYLGGKGIQRDNTEAAAWFRKAAEQGVAPSQMALGYLHENGLGVPKDEMQAYMWYSLAADGGMAEANAMLNALAKRMRPSDVSEAKQLMRDWIATHKRLSE